MLSNFYIRGCVFSLLVLVFSVAAIAQAGSVDLTFNAVPQGPAPTDINFQQIIQSDGKVIVYGAPTVSVNGVTRSGMFRLNTDGTIDTSFSYNNEGGVGINNIMLTPDGKIVLAGSTSPNHAKMVRLNPDGSLDGAFTVFIAAVGSPSFTGNWLTVNAIQPDGKVIATHSSWGNIQGTWYSYSMRRYNLDGSVDSSFTSPSLDGGHLVNTTVLAEMLPDGRFYLGVTSRSHLGGTLRISRRLANGSPDATYSPFSASIAPSAFLTISDLAVANDGGVLASGVFAQTAVGFPPRDQMRRFLPDGSSFPGFAAPLVFTGGGVHQLPDGKILYSASGGTAARPLMRLETNGSLDNTYVLDPAVISLKNAWRIDPMNRLVVLAQTAAGPRLVRLLENGSLDPAFNVEFVQPPVPSTVNTLAVQGDGKMIVAGPFSFMNGATRGRIARLNADGSLDSTFDSGTGFAPYAPEKLVLQPDGKILAWGDFTSYNGTPVSEFVRINADGSIDNTFSVNVSNIVTVAIQSDGRILIGGSFSNVNGTPRKNLARLTSTGALDPDFNVVIADSGGNSYIADILVQPDGKIMIGGRYTSVDGTDRKNVARLESTGSLDLTFNAPTSGDALLILRQPDGRYVINDYNQQRLIRRHIDGSVDTSFTTSIPKDQDDSNGYISTVLLMPDGTVLMGGSFAKINGIPRYNLVCLKPNGTVDPSFATNPNASVTSLRHYSTGQVMIAGSFLAVDAFTRFGIARLNITPFVLTTPFDFDGDGRSDISVLRPSTNRWYEVMSSTGAVYEETFGLAGDVLSPADFDGDGITDEAIFRPSNGHWWYRSSLHGGLTMNPFGGAGDIPRPSDFDGDGKADLVLFRPSSNTWFRYSSLTNSEATPLVFGLAGDQPLVGDFDGDGKSDPAIFRPSNGDWWYAASSAGGAFRTVHWGQNGDIPVPADFDGDGRTDYAVYRPSQGGWYIYNSSNGSFTTTAFGVAGDRPVAADYDGDGRADIAVFRPSTGIWYLLRSTSGFAGYQFGISTDIALPGALIP